jgi:hypothetical protein
MSRLPVPRFLLCLLLVLLAGSSALASETGWTLWKNNGIAGVVSVRSADGMDRVGLKRMAEILGCQSTVKGDTLMVTSGRRTLEFVLGAAAARRESGQILPLAAAVKAEEGEWWAENRGTLRLFESLLSRTGAVVRLRFAGTGPLPENPDSPAPPATVSSTDPVSGPLEVAPSVYGPLPQVRGIRWSRTVERIRAVLDLSAAVEPDVKTFPGSVEVTLRAASNRSLSGVPSPYPGDVSVGITQFGEKLVVRFQHSAGSVKAFTLHKPERIVVDFLATPLPASFEPAPQAIPVEPPPASLAPFGFSREEAGREALPHRCRCRARWS